MSCLREAVLACRAERTFKILGKVLELCSRSNTVLGSALFLVIFPSAEIANVFYVFHLRFFVLPHRQSL